MNARLILLTCVLALSAGSASAQGIKSDLREAFEEYNKKRYKAAERMYRKAFTQDSLSVKANLGLGNALYKRGLYDKALPYYQRAIDLGELKGEQAASLMHNLGNALFKKKEYQKSIEAYEQALTHNPSDDETRYNLVKAQKLLPKQQQPPQSQPQQDPNQKPEQQPQQNKPEQKPPQDKEDQKQNPNQQPNNPQQQEDKSKINKDQAEKLLEAFKKADEETRRRVEQRKQQHEQEQNNKNRRKW